MKPKVRYCKSVTTGHIYYFIEYDKRFLNSDVMERIKKYCPNAKVSDKMPYIEHSLHINSSEVSNGDIIFFDHNMVILINPYFFDEGYCIELIDRDCSERNNSWEKISIYLALIAGLLLIYIIANFLQ